VRLRPQILDTTGVLRWRVFIEQSGKVLKRWAGTGNSSLPHYLDWYISKKQSVVPLDTSVVICQLEVVYKYQSKPVSSRLLTIPIERVSIAEKRSKKANDFAKNRYNLILFDVGSDRLSGVNERIVSSIRNTTLFSTTSSVRILGYTDAVGAEDVNALLSQRRAESAAQTLAVTPQMVRELIIKGRGEALPLLYENETPEGRFYCRAVVIEIDTPVKYD
ncbi:MAG: OmpA family protein, partial [Candidatus Kapabacteria bacterium]|nr:OmpA family protein [Candidatus Kapabacteria bacterium]